ncbi:AraC-like DNA-binding protein [Paenibacillus taihuensis]|uniref:AraC-like DNA-binding protein n=1 Tax=Paenibacillus taihuensis TaxID=1156355 RepID=A0A3D9SDH8_9BACL|nr:AraC family transcriptional regulator [Paenibacillus taihuensis]REE87450.1 AraC-like DNA-binding protein [Paenibacillus taihuensis]
MEIIAGGGCENAEFLYYTPNDLDKENAIWPVRGGVTETRRGYSAGPKSIESYSLHAVREGSILLEYDDGKSATLKAGDVFCLFPMRTYTYRAIEGEPLPQMSWIVIDGPGAERLLALAGLSCARPFSSQKWKPEAERAINGLLGLMRGGETDAVVLTLEMQSLLYRLFAAVCGSVPNARPQETSDWVKRSMAYIQYHAFEGITVQQAAKAAGMNRTYYSVAFAEKTGKSPSDYITQVRLDKAKRLLAETDASITEVAYTTGYSSLYAFTRTFKNRFSITPTAYRDSSDQQRRLYE